jgi:hypothetical protein
LSERVSEKPDQTTHRQELAHINQRILDRDARKTASATPCAAQEVTSHPDPVQRLGLSYRRNPDIDQVRLEIQTVKPESGLTADGGVWAPEQHRCPCPLLEAVHERRGVVQPLCQSSPVPLVDQPAQGVVPHAERGSLRVGDETKLGSDQAPLGRGQVLTLPHACIFGIAGSAASGHPTPCGKTRKL